MQCPQCHKQITVTDRFCGGCGHAVTAGAAPIAGLPARDHRHAAGLVLVVQCPDQPEVAAALDRARLTIGRGATCDVVIDAPAVSRLHAVLEKQDGAFVLRDQGSTNGIYVEGERVAESVLREGVPVRIPDPFGNLITLTIRRVTGSGALPPAPAAVEQSRTVPLVPGRAVLSIGRAPENDLRLDVPLVSRHHARIERGGDTVVLRDLDSTNGSYVNGERVRGVRVLALHDAIQIGPARFRFEGGALRQLTQQPAIRLDAINLIRRVGRGTPRVILNNVSLSILPREFVVLVGGSGAGKSTLLHALSGAAPAQSGMVLFNGQDFYRQPGPYSSMIGYVPQDDLLHRDLPVTRALDYAAQLRLPPDTSPDERARRITEVLAEVKMEPFRDQVISSLSGGQRKRVSIAVELLANPSVIFLDEPTSGLDPGLDKTVMGLLQLLCDKGHTIVLVTHATSNIGLCNLVAFVAGQGRLVYYGPPADAPGFFGVSAFPDIYSFFDQQPGEAERQEARFQQSDQYQTYVLGRRQEAAQTVVPATPPVARDDRQRAAAWRQWKILTARYAELLRRDRVNLALLLAQAPIVGVLLALVASGDSFTPLALGGSQQVLLMLTLAAIWFGTINAAREIVKERPIYGRERMVNLRIWPYVLSKFAVLSALALAQALILLVLVGLKTSHLPGQGILLPSMAEMYITLALTAFAGLAGGLLISSLVSSADRAMSIVPVVLLAQVIFSGGVFDLSGATNVLSWLSISRWCLVALGSTVNLNALAARVTPAPPTWPKEMFSAPDAAHLVGYWLVLIAFAVLFLLGTYWSLRRRDVRGV